MFFLIDVENLQHISNIQDLLKNIMKIYSILKEYWWQSIAFRGKNASGLDSTYYFECSIPHLHKVKIFTFQSNRRENPNNAERKHFALNAKWKIRSAYEMCWNWKLCIMSSFQTASAISWHFSFNNFLVKELTARQLWHVS